MTPERAPLPPRRPSVTREVEIGGRRITVTVGFYLDGRPGEVFAGGHKEGSEMQRVMDDACVIISVALQHGVRPVALAASLGLAPDPWRGAGATTWACPMGWIMAVIQEAEASLARQTAP